jgi:predicted phage terminase large subunit-like protein
MDTDSIAAALDEVPPEELSAVIESLPIDVVEALLNSGDNAVGVIPPDPAQQAHQLDPGYRLRPHTVHLSERIAQAVADVENGMNRMLRVTMPPRMGKSTLCSLYLPIWLLRKHPEWKIGMISHDGDFATSWGRNVRRFLDNNPELGVPLARDVGAASEWETSEHGGVLARSVGGSITGRGFKVLLLDDVVKDFATAHHALSRQRTWDWWLSVAQTRLEPPYLVIVIGTRWHEDDFTGRLVSPDYEGDSAQWELIDFPAVAETHDVLGRAPGEPLLSPLMEETTEEALVRWSEVKANVGTYTWAALYQQRPAPVEGAIFDISWWRFWTRDPRKADGERIVHFDPEEHPKARWLDSWDCAFKGGDNNDFVVGQRWCRTGPDRYLIAQTRARMTFTKTLEKMLDWADPEALDTPIGTRFIRERLVEDKANGPAVIDVLRRQVDGLIPVNPTNSKEGRAHSVTPEVEAGNVYLPLPSDPGNEWVNDLMGELRAFPNDAYDDQVDALTQALSRLRDGGKGQATVPGRKTPPSLVERRITQTALRGGRPGQPSPAAAAAARLPRR